MLSPWKRGEHATFIKNSIFTNKTSEIETHFSSILVYELSYGDESIIVIHNFAKVNVEINVSKLGVNKILDEISVSRQIPELNNNILKIGNASTVILSK